MKYIDRILNQITMYRVVLYGLMVLFLNAVVASAAGWIFYQVAEILLSFAAIFIASTAAHYLLAALFKAPANLESTLITSFILTFVLLPTMEVGGLLGLACAGIVAVASKYVLAVRKIHVFNPAAFAAVVLGIPLIAPALWWIGTPSMIPLTLIVALLIVRKIHRFDLFLSTIAASVVTVVALALVQQRGVDAVLVQHFLSWPILFFAGVMVTEPLTTPPRRMQRIIYGVAIGVLSSLPLHIGIVYTTPEFTLVLANLAAFFLGLRRRLVLPLEHKEEIAKNTWEFTFTTPKSVTFLPGQYLEWVLPHDGADNRGIKRYFTIAASPTEDSVKIGVKFPEKPSSFKSSLLSMKKGDVIYASQLSGDFTLPKNEEKPLVFIAGGIGITPFRSMAQYMIDSDTKRDATLFFTCRQEGDFCYKDVFEKAQTVGLKSVFVVTDKDAQWDGEKGFIDVAMLSRHVSAVADAQYYISGPPTMVDAYKSMLKGAGVPRMQIHTDYFPGYA